MTKCVQNNLQAEVPYYIIFSLMLKTLKRIQGALISILATQLIMLLFIYYDKCFV